MQRSATLHNRVPGLLLLLFLLFVIIVLYILHDVLVAVPNEGIKGPYGIEILHWSILVYVPLLVIVMVIVVDPAPSPIHQIKFLSILGPQPHPLHPRTTLRPLANTEAIYFGDIHFARSTFLTTIRVGIDEWWLVRGRARR